MPSFDVVSEVDKHELQNAVDQARRDLEHRFDLRGTGAEVTLEDFVIQLRAANEFQLGQLGDLLGKRLAGRGIDLRALDEGEVQTNLSGARRSITVRQGIEQAQAKKIVATIKQARFKVDTQITGAKLRVVGKKRDDLQAVIALLRKEDFDLPLQFENFRD